MRKTIFLMAFMIIAACSSPEERAQREAQKEIDECTEAGYKPGTDAFEDCRLQVKTRDDQRMADRIKAASDIPSLQPSHTTLPQGTNIPIP